jgi:hypothetical protein
VTLAGILALGVVSPAIVGIWQNGWLYLHLPAAKISLNGKTTEENKIYKGASGDHSIFLENESAERTVFRVSSQPPKVGIPVSPVPSS